MFGSQLFTSCVKCEKARRFRERCVFMRLPSLLVVTSAITCSRPVLSAAGWRMTRAEYCWPSSCQLMVFAVVLVSSSFCATLLHVAREHDLLGLRDDIGRAFGFRLGDHRNLRRRLRGGGHDRARRGRRLDECRRCVELLRPRESLPASAWHPPSSVHRKSCSLVPGSSSTSSTGSGAGCGSAASVNSSLVRAFARDELHRELGHVLVVVDRSGTSRCRRRARTMRCTAAEMPSEVLTSRWGRNASPKPYRRRD